tara:strand:- start:134 stop:313 length:180 start_codon:yes stop_codon:yes gene_type:complete
VQRNPVLFAHLDLLAKEERKGYAQSARLVNRTLERTEDTQGQLQYHLVVLVLLAMPVTF